MSRRPKDLPCDFEIDAGELTRSTALANEPITPERREALLAMDRVQI